MPEKNSLTVYVPRLIPVQVVATDSQGNDHLIGDFEGGVVLSGTALQDVRSSEIIALHSMRDNSWIIKGKRYRYVFVQVKPQD